MVGQTFSAQSKQIYFFRATPYAACPFWLLGSPFRGPGARCLHFDILGDHFSTSGATWGVILAPRDHPGGPWEQQDGHEVANNRICVDFGVISGLVYVSSWGSKCVKNRFTCGLELSTSGTSKSLFSH